MKDIDAPSFFGDGDHDYCKTFVSSGVRLGGNILALVSSGIDGDATDGAGRSTS